jgi:hypothetical protein
MEIWNEIVEDADSGAKRLVAEYGDRLFTAACRIVQNDSEAEDLVFRTFERAILKIGQYDGRCQFFSWLYSVMLNFRRMDLRRKGANALDFEGEMAVGINGASTMTLSKLDVWGTPLWTRAFPTEGVELEGVVFDSQGNVGFWGSINGQIELGAAPFIARSAENGPLGLFGVLGSDGSPRFVRTTSMQSIRRVVADRTGHLLVVGTHVNGFEWLLDRYNVTGERTHVRGGEQLLPSLALGLSGDAAVDSRGAVYWQFIPLLGGTPLNYLAKLRPF